jgi:hypothetical protein
MSKAGDEVMCSALEAELIKHPHKAEVTLAILVAGELYEHFTLGKPLSDRYEKLVADVERLRA